MSTTVTVTETADQPPPEPLTAEGTPNGEQREEETASNSSANENSATDFESALMPPPPLPPPTVKNQLRRDCQQVRWTKIRPTVARNGYLPGARHGHRALAFKHLMIVFGGGKRGIIDDLNVYNTLTNEWSQPQVKGDIPTGKASFGAVIDGQRILIFGGMEEYVDFSDKLYELNVQKWEWTQLRPGTRSDVLPCGRIGHSFTLMKDRVFMYGGLTMEGCRCGTVDCYVAHRWPHYLGDLHVLYVRLNMQHGMWEEPVTFGRGPGLRESHSAVGYVSKDGRHNKLVVYGGMFGDRLGDLFTLDIDTMMWSEIKYDLKSYYPKARSLHSASLVGDKMYVFGGWVDADVPKRDDEGIKQDEVWKVDNSVACLNLKTMMWEEVVEVGGPDEPMIPAPRAGHSAAVINNRIYVWSGRDGYNKVPGPHGDLLQVCFNETWKLEVQKPGVPDKVMLLKAMSDRVVVGWEPVPGADAYVIQCMQFEMPPSTTINCATDEKESAGGAQTPATPMQVAHDLVPSKPTPDVRIPGQTDTLQVPAQNVFGPAFPNAQGQQIFSGPNIFRPPMQHVPVNAFPPSNTLRPGAYPNFMAQNLPPRSINATTQLVQRPGGNCIPVNGTPNFRPACPQNMVGPMQPATGPTATMASGIAPKFNWQNVSAPNQPTRVNVSDVMRLMAAQQRQPLPPARSLLLAAPNVPPANTRPAQPSEPIPPNSNAPASLLMPPPPPPTTMASSVTPDAQNAPLAQPPRQFLQGGTVPQGSAVIQRPGSFVRILGHSPSRAGRNPQQTTQQRFYLTGSHGIPGTSPAQSQPQPRPLNNAPVLPNTKQMDQGEVNSSIPVPPQQGTPYLAQTVPFSQSFVRPIQQTVNTIRLTQQQFQSFVMNSNRPGLVPVRYVMQGQPNQEVARALPKYIACRMPDGTNMMLPAHMLHSGSIRHVRLAGPLPLKKDDGRKMVAVEGMLQLAGGHNVQKIVPAEPKMNEQEGTPQQAVASEAPTPVQEPIGEDTKQDGGGENCASSETVEEPIAAAPPQQKPNVDHNQNESSSEAENGLQVQTEQHSSDVNQLCNEPPEDPASKN